MLVLDEAGAAAIKMSLERAEAVMTAALKELVARRLENEELRRRLEKYEPIDQNIKVETVPFWEGRCDSGN